MLFRLLHFSYFQALPVYWTAWRLLPALFPTRASAPLFGQPGASEIPPSHHIDAEHSTAPNLHNTTWIRTAKPKWSISLSLPWQLGLKARTTAPGISWNFLIPYENEQLCKSKRKTMGNTYESCGEHIPYRLVFWRRIWLTIAVHFQKLVERVLITIICNSP